MFATGARRKSRVPVLFFLLLVLLASRGYRYLQVCNLAPATTQVLTDDGSGPEKSRPAGTSPLRDEPFNARCVGVKDGDTLALLTARKEEVTVRLFGVDAPEKKQAFGERARQFVSDTVFGKNVRVHPHARDRYGRVVADVYLEDDSRLNTLLVREGLAWWYKAYAPNDTELQHAEAQARSEQRGLWRDPDPVPPWEFRRGKNVKPRENPKTTAASS